MEGDLARFQLRLAHSELKKDDPGGWPSGRDSLTMDEDKLQSDLARARR